MCTFYNMNGDVARISFTGTVSITYTDVVNDRTHHSNSWLSP
jgi:hypothetical protein